MFMYQNGTRICIFFMCGLNRVELLFSGNHFILIIQYFPSCCNVICLYMCVYVWVCWWYFYSVCKKCLALSHRLPSHRVFTLWGACSSRRWVLFLFFRLPLCSVHFMTIIYINIYEIDSTFDCFHFCALLLYWDCK